MKIRKKEWTPENTIYEYLPESEDVNIQYQKCRHELEQIFKHNPAAVKIEEVKYVNGNESISIKDRDNKILIQYTLEK